MSSPFQDHFSGGAADYARFRPGYPPGLFAALAARAPGHERAWDCATGSGQAALALAEHFSEVWATDASERQVAHAAAHPRVRYRVAPAEASGLEAESIDLVTVAQALHWFDRPQFFQEAGRVLRPGGLLAVWCYERLEVDDPQAQATLDEFYAVTLGPCWPPERQFVEEGYRSFLLPFPEEPAPHCRMEANLNREALTGYLGTWSAVRRYREQHGQDPLVPLGRKLAVRWPDAAAARRVTWPLHIRTARKPGAGQDSA